MRLSGKVAIITGAANGIGRETAVLFAHEGARVVVVDRDEDAGVKTLDQLEGDNLFVQADVSSESDIAQVVEQTVSRSGGIDILVNNAGVAIGGTVSETPALLTNISIPPDL